MIEKSASISWTSSSTIDRSHSILRRQSSASKKTTATAQGRLICFLERPGIFLKNNSSNNTSAKVRVNDGNGSSVPVERITRRRCVIVSNNNSSRTSTARDRKTTASFDDGANKNERETFLTNSNEKSRNMMKFLGVFTVVAISDVLFFGLGAGLQWTGTARAAFTRSAFASIVTGVVLQYWRERAFSSNSLFSYSLACASYASASLLSIVCFQAAKVSFTLGTPWQFVAGFGGVAAVTLVAYLIKFAQKLARSAAKISRDSLNNEALSASVNFASAVGTIKKAMAKEFEKEMTRSVEKIEKELEKALEAKKTAEDKLAKIISERSAEVQKMNARFSKASAEEDTNALKEEMKTMKATFESAQGAAQYEFTRALKQERALNREKITEIDRLNAKMMEKQQVEKINGSSFTMSDNDVIAIVSKLQEEKDREIQRVVQTLLSEKFEREASFKVQKATSESALLAAQQQIAKELSEYRAKIESIEAKNKFQRAERDALYRLQSSEYAKYAERDRDYSKADAEDAVKVLYDLIEELKEEQMKIVSALQTENLDSIAAILAERDEAVNAIENELKKMKAAFETSLASAQENFKVAQIADKAVEEKALELLKNALGDLKMAKQERDCLYTMLQSESAKGVSLASFESANEKISKLEARVEALSKYSADDKRHMRDMFVSEVAKAKKTGLEQIKPIEDALKNARKERNALYKLAAQENLKLNHQQDMAALDLGSFERELEAIGIELRQKTAIMESALNANQQFFSTEQEKWKAEETNLNDAMNKLKNALQIAKNERNNLYKLAQNESRKASARLEEVLNCDRNFQKEMERLEGELLTQKNKSSELSDKTKNQMETLKKQNESDILQAKRETEQAKKDVKVQIAEIEQKHAKQLENAKESALRAEEILLGKIASVQQEQKKTITKLEQNHENSLKESRAASESSQSILVANVSKLQKQINESKDAYEKTIAKLESDAKAMKEISDSASSLNAYKNETENIRKELEEAISKAKKTADLIEQIKNESEGRVIEAQKAAKKEAEIARVAFQIEIDATTEELERRARQFIEAEKILKEYAAKK